MPMPLLKKENVFIRQGADDWREAIRLAVKPLEEQGYVETTYKDAIISSVEELGAYIVIAPYVALPHARPEHGVIRSQISVTLFRDDVWFDRKEIPTKLFIVLAAADGSSHLDALVTISNMLQEEDHVKHLIDAESPEALYQYFT